MTTSINYPTKLTVNALTQFFEQAKIANFSPDDYQKYEDSLKYYRDLKNSLDTAKEEGRLEGRAEGLVEGKAEGLVEGRTEGRIEEKLAIAKNLKSLGLNLELIKQSTGLSDDDISHL